MISKQSTSCMHALCLWKSYEWQPQYQYNACGLLLKQLCTE